MNNQEIIGANKLCHPNRRIVIYKTIEAKLAIAENLGQHEMLVPIDIMKEILSMMEDLEPVALTRSYSVYRCGKCGYIVGIDDIKGVPGYKNRYCADCGRGVKWHD